MSTKVLLVDDEPETLNLLKAFLELYSYDVAIAQDGRTAMTLVEEFEPDAMVLDIMLPDIDGYTLCRNLRSVEKTAMLPVVMLSARTHRMDVRRGYEAGATRYLKKPVSLDKLAKALSEVSAKPHTEPTQEQRTADERDNWTGLE
ncbi:MAG: response regulator [Chloroflexi bacterium]|nr:response regulator [Chloroflexota bacterium]